MYPPLFGRVHNGSFRRVASAFAQEHACRMRHKNNCSHRHILLASSLFSLVALVSPAVAADASTPALNPESNTSAVADASASASASASTLVPALVAELESKSETDPKTKTKLKTETETEVSVEPDLFAADDAVVEAAVAAEYQAEEQKAEAAQESEKLVLVPTATEKARNAIATATVVSTSISRLPPAKTDNVEVVVDVDALSEVKKEVVPPFDLHQGFLYSKAEAIEADRSQLRMLRLRPLSPQRLTDLGKLNHEQFQYMEAIVRDHLIHVLRFAAVWGSDGTVSSWGNLEVGHGHIYSGDQTDAQISVLALQHMQAYAPMMKEFDGHYNGEDLESLQAQRASLQEKMIQDLSANIQKSAFTELNRNEVMQHYQHKAETIADIVAQSINAQRQSENAATASVATTAAIAGGNNIATASSAAANNANQNSVTAAVEASAIAAAEAVSGAVDSAVAVQQSQQDKPTISDAAVEAAAKANYHSHKDSSATDTEAVNPLLATLSEAERRELQLRREHSGLKDQELQWNQADIDNSLSELRANHVKGEDYDVPETFAEQVGRASMFAQMYLEQRYNYARNGVLIVGTMDHIEQSPHSDRERQEIILKHTQMLRNEHQNSNLFSKQPTYQLPQNREN